MKYVLSVVCLLALASWSQAFHRQKAHGCSGNATPACQGKTAACTGTKVTACQGAPTSGCFGVVSVPRRTVTKTTVDCAGNITQTSRSRGTVSVAVPVQSVQQPAAPPSTPPYVDKLPPKKK